MMVGEEVIRFCICVEGGMGKRKVSNMISRFLASALKRWTSDVGRLRRELFLLHVIKPFARIPGNQLWTY